MNQEIQARITHIRTSLQWMNLASDDARRVQAELALVDAVHYADRVEDALERAVAALDRPADGPQEERVGTLLREPVRPQETVLRGEVGTR